MVGGRKLVVGRGVNSEWWGVKVKVTCICELRH